MYQPPTIVELGTLSELTLSNIYKNAGTGDVIIINGAPTPVPGNGVISVS